MGNKPGLMNGRVAFVGLIAFTLVAAYFSPIGGKRIIYEEHAQDRSGLTAVDDPPEAVHQYGD